MKNKIYLCVGVFIATVFVWGILGIVSVSAGPATRKIIVFKPGVLNESAKNTLVEQSGGIKIKNLNSIGARVALLSLKAEKTLRQHPEVLRIDDDVIVEALARSNSKAKPFPIPSSQILPWGINRIDADLVWWTTTANSIKVGVIDTGIDVKHPDLKDNLKGGVSAVNYTASYNDDNGHGTHVAGIMGALNNSIGVVGVGPKVSLYAIKVLDRKGSGYLSDVIEGIDWAIANGVQVINMSLGTTADIQSFHDAVIRANKAGIVQVAAAGNDGKAVNFPAAYSEVIAVSASDNADNVAYWSSRGPEIDLAAPGVDIYSTYKGQTYKTLSGTSMASPHVAGAASLVLTTPVGLYDLDGDGAWDPIEVQNKLQATAEDLGASGWDSLFGYGLVDAEKAVTR